MIFLDNGAMDFKELNDFIDRKNLDPIGYYLVSTKALSMLKIKNLIEKNLESLNLAEILDKVKFLFFIFD